MAIKIRDQLYDAVARVVAGGPAESVDLSGMSGHTVPDVAMHVARGVYLATWGRPVSTVVLMGPGGVSVVVSTAGASHAGKVGAS